MAFSTARLVLLLALYWLFAAPTCAHAGQGTVVRAVSGTNRYDKAHSLGDNYRFDPRDGWQVANASDLEYKYRQELGSANVQRRAAKHHDHVKHTGQGVGGALNKLLKTIGGMLGFGKPQPVTITWYTGHDLKNPSCWANGKWEPTDASFVAALTEYGWHEKPKCFKFIELDTCAGCAANSKHVDLTKAAFGELADFDRGILTVQYRHATDPDSKDWNEKLWGPRVHKRK
ncbi:hypothetical protein EST38_g11456 [Candolleomyces aberdarensis]|uniref:RlpA-like protein double-psi beta-barrel domain-containing protein n=1 Tax=Candolleomyces aberdarensis TaxID=2316362 RepID=A0A4Q2D7I2_9AGAR|nr:hypothetical protein EST38_g11456 [Candolleomyces aberdarensis]